MENEIKRLNKETERPNSIPQAELKQELTNLQKQFKEVQQDFEDLDASCGDLHDYTRRLEQRLKQVEQRLKERVPRLNCKTDDWNERTQDVEEIQQQLELLQNRTQDLDQIQPQLDTLKGVLKNLSTEIPVPVNVAVEKQVLQLNQILKGIQCRYKYELVFGRLDSRNVLIEALEKAQERLIMVCPWLAKHGTDQEVIEKCKALLKRSIRIDIGWSRLEDLEKDKINDSSEWYTALPKLRQLEQDYPKHFKMYKLGTHAKYLVCDRSFAMLGSHNFLTSSASSQELEVGLRTTDRNIIKDLIDYFDFPFNPPPF